MLLALGETLAAAKLAAQNASDAKHAVEDAVSRVNRLEQEVAGLKARHEEMDIASSRQANPWTITAVVISLLGLFTLILLNVYQINNPEGAGPPANRGPASVTTDTP
jgi:hypothetical protein